MGGKRGVWESVNSGSQMKVFPASKWSTPSNAVIGQVRWELRNDLWIILLIVGYQLLYIF